MIIKHLPDQVNDEVAVVPQNEQDLFLLSKLIQAGFIVKTITDRKIQLNESKTVRVTLSLELKVTQTQYQQLEQVLIINGTVTRCASGEVSMGQSHSMHQFIFNKITFLKHELTQAQIQQLIVASDVAKNAQSFLCLILRDGTAKYAYIDENEFYQVKRFNQAIPKKDRYNDQAIKQRTGEFNQKVATMLRQAIDVSKIKNLYILAQDDLLDQLKPILEKQFIGTMVKINYQTSKSVNFGDAHRELFTNQQQEQKIFDNFKENLSTDNNLSFCGVDCIRCMQQQPKTVSELLVLKSMLCGDYRVEVDQIISSLQKENLKSSGLKFILVSDNSQIGLQLKCFCGAICNTKFQVYLENAEFNPDNGKEFTKWDYFEECSDI